MNRVHRAPRAHLADLLRPGGRTGTHTQHSGAGQESSPQRSTVSHAGHHATTLPLKSPKLAVCSCGTPVPVNLISQGQDTILVHRKDCASQHPKDLFSALPWPLARSAGHTAWQQLGAGTKQLHKSGFPVCLLIFSYYPCLFSSFASETSFY